MRATHPTPPHFIDIESNVHAGAMGGLPLILLVALAVTLRCIVRSILKPSCENLHGSWIRGKFALLGMIKTTPIGRIRIAWGGVGKERS
jgi:hypothetical protein